MTTIYDIAQGVRTQQYNGSPIADGLIPRRLPKLKEGIHHLSAEQTLSLRVSLLEVDGSITGYQRNSAKAIAHVRRIAEAVHRGVLMPSATVAEFEGEYYLTDGGHRALGHIIAREPFRVEVRHLNPAEQRELFHNQAKAKKLGAANAVLTGESPVDLYVQDVFTAPETPWAGLISLTSRRRSLSPVGLAGIALIYASGKLGPQRQDQRKFDPKVADELAPLLRAFGTPSTNPLAFEAMAVRAIAGAATLILRRPDCQPGDRDRWMRHMPKFEFADHQHLRSQTPLRLALLAHWNRRLPADRKVEAE